MTNFRALCADLLRELDHASAWDYQQALKDQARAALAEPQPAANGEVAELVAWLRRLERSPLGLSMDGYANLTRAAELLERLSAQPTDEELDELYFDLDATEVQSWRAFARAVLARWGTPNLAETRSSLEPIPVSERRILMTIADELEGQQ